MAALWALSVLVVWSGQGSMPPPLKAPIVTVRVIDARDGRAYVNLPVFITLHRWKLNPGDQQFGSAANVEEDFRKTTDANGEVSFRLPQPLPPEIVADAGGPYACGKTLFDTQQILRGGIVSGNGCKGKVRKMRVKFQARPGEVVVFARPFSFWDGVFDAIH